MAEERRLENTEIREAVDRDSRAEALLVEGLDRYFAGRYDEAIHIWTRVLFLDRSHARARAYIDRARTALAEGQRRAEEMLQATGDLIAAGDTLRARALLSQVVATAGDDERAATLRVLLERAERAGVGNPAGRQAIVDAVRVRSHTRSSARSVGWYAAGGAVVVLAVVATSMMSPWATKPAPLPAVRTSVELPVLSTSEAALVRARTLYARGRLAEALRALDRVDPDSANRTAAEGLRVEIQQVLLAAVREVQANRQPKNGRCPMKCPKCHYLSFEPEPRCKNCGYGFSLSEPDLPMRVEERTEPASLGEFSFRNEVDRADSARAAATVSQASVAAVLDEADEAMPLATTAHWPPIPEPRPSRPMPRVRPRQVSAAPLQRPAPTTELPLFVTGIPARPDDPVQVPAEEPVSHLETEASPTPESAKPPSVGREGRGDMPVRQRNATASRKPGPLDRDLLEDLDRIERTEQRAVRAREVAAGNAAAYAPGTLRRSAAALLDALFVSGLALGVVGVTLRWCDLSFDQAVLLPVWPMATFVLVLNALYLFMFTVAGGQTVGKMVVGIRVVDSDAALDTLTLRQATYRALLTLPSVLLCGAGFVPALVGDERALHDRLTHTRVVRA